MRAQELKARRRLLVEAEDRAAEEHARASVKHSEAEAIAEKKKTTRKLEAAEEVTEKDPCNANESCHD